MTQESFQIDVEVLESDLAAISEKAKTVYNTEVYKKIAFSCIDLTSLNATDTSSKIKCFTQKVNDFAIEFGDMPNVAAICVFPNSVDTVEATLALPEVNIASVAGGFPSSMTFTKIKADEAKMAVKKGADEIDIVLALSEFMDGNYEEAHRDIATIKAAIGDAHLKVILETGALETPEEIWRASVLAINAGADFIKTSTGKMSPAATPMAAYVMCQAIAWHFEQTGERVGFKPAGGIVTVEDALLYLAIVSEILGDEWLTPKLFRIGASRLANNLLTDITGRDVVFF
jgi:deoxyribose-phosphate aldolase